MLPRRAVLLSLTLIPLAGAGIWARANRPPISAAFIAQPKQRSAATPMTKADKIVAGARAQIGDLYSPQYFSIAYPNGDIPKGRGACTDVVVRSLRRAGTDLQRLVHEDMKAHFSAYPRKWGLSRPDSNIDHRRVPNLQAFFRRKGASLPLTVGDGSDWKPGDVVTWKLDNGLDHCGIVTDTRGPSGLPQVVHNLGPCLEADCLTTWKITGHYRYPK